MFKENKNPLQAVIDEITNIFDSLFGNNITLDEFAKNASAKIDEIILKEIENGKEFAAGRFYVSLVDAATFRTSFELYFKDEDGKFLSMTGQGKTVSISVLQSKDQKELKSMEKITYEVNEPTKKVADNTGDKAEANAPESILSKHKSDINLTDALKFDIESKTNDTLSNSKK